MRPRRGRQRLAGPLAAGGAVLVIVCWLLDVAGHGAPRGLARAVLAVALAGAAVVLGRLAAALWRGERLGTPDGRILLAVLAAAGAAQLVGLGHEIGELYFADEGTFLAQAQRINAGRALRPWFVYPHFLFYWDAFALWIAGLGGRIVPAAARLLWGVAGDLEVAALVTRVASSTLAALAAVPVFLAARRLAGAPAAAAAGALLALSPTWVEVGHLNLADVPAAAFAAAALWAVAALLARESLRGYVLAGLAAGLAAGSKYPAGIVAVALAGPWFRGLRGLREPRTRRLSTRLGWLAAAALAAIAALLLTTPSFLRWPGAAFGGEGADLLFGARLYSQAGWQGIVRASNALFYLDELGRAFGWPALLLGAAGWALATRDLRRRALWLLPFPVVFLGLLLVLKVALRRNLLPVLPFLALFLAIGLAAIWERLAGLSSAGRRRLARTALAAAVLATPAVATATLLVRLSRPTTREVAADWIRAHLPPGSFLVQEQYTPLLTPEALFPARKPRFAARLAPEVLRDPAHDFLFLSSAAYQRFLEPRNLDDLANPEVAKRYRELFATLPLVREWAPGRFQDGPALRLYRLDPDPVSYAAARELPAAEALVSDPAMKPGGAEVLFGAGGGWALFKAHLGAGTYVARLDATASAQGRLRVRDRENLEHAAIAAGAASARFELPRPDKYFFYLELPPGSRLRGLRVTRDTPGP